MTLHLSSLGKLSDRDLLVHVQRAAKDERDATSHLIALLMEVDTRRLYLGQGYSSLFTYCTQVLHLSEHAAYGRIEAARAARRFPVILELLADGAVTLTTIGLLSPHLTDDNHVNVLHAARHQSKREVEHLVARLHPRPDVAAIMRKLPERRPILTTVSPDTTEELSREVLSPPAPPVTATTKRSEVKPLAPERYKIQFTVNRETYEQLRQAQDLLRHVIPNGDPGAIFERALTLLVEQLSRSRHAALRSARRRQEQTRSGPRPPKTTGVPPHTSRYIPAAVKREVWKRDGGRCAFKGEQGRCMETGFLEFHHVVPFAVGGETTSSNLELRCRAHNAHEAEKYFGSWKTPLLRETPSEWG